ncbi:MAG: TetR/AcrR family transcriptional regulator [Gammaproteobacteria bacterium]|nr:TetR/AcrR family transcriptional regulator [Gammaproteobacteria bacterium]
MPDVQSPQFKLIIAAAKQCYLSDGISGTGMAEVAATAGVARSTLYRYFAGRDELLIATVQDEMLQLNTFLRRKLDRLPDPADQLVEGLLLAIREIPRRKLLNAVFASEQDVRARHVVWGSDTIVRFGEELMSHVIGPATSARLLQDEVPAEVMIEWVYRLLLSFLTLPSNTLKNEQALRATLRALLVPVLLKPH